MLGSVIIDTNLLLLLIVGSTDKTYIAKHKRLENDYTIADWENLVQIVSLFSEIVVLPNTLTEVSNFARHLAKPARSRVQAKLRDFISKTYELYVQSRVGVERGEFIDLGLTDAVLLHVCSQPLSDADLTLLSVDKELLDNASSLGYQTFDYKEWIANL